MLMTCLCRYATTHATNWVAEHLGASSRRPRHPFPALMAGAAPGRVPVYTAQKKREENPSSHEQHLWSSTTATIALQLELEVVVVVGTNNVKAAEPTIQHAKTPNVLLVLEIKDDEFSSPRPHAVPNTTVKLSARNLHHHTRHRDANTPAAGQSADEEHEVTTVAVATMVQSFKGTVNDTTVNSATGAVNTKIPLYFPLETGFAKSIHKPKPRSDGRHNT